MHTLRLLALLGAIALLAPRPSAAAAPDPSSARLARAQELADDFHDRLRFRFQERPEEDRLALARLIESGALGLVVKTWKETRVQVMSEPEIQEGSGLLELPDAVRIADRFIEQQRPGYKWKRGRAYRKGETWTVEYTARGRAGLRAKVKVDARTGAATL